MYGSENTSFPYFYGNYFYHTFVRRFDSKTGKSEIVDTISPNNMDPAGNLMLPEHDVYITDSAAWVYSFFLSDTIYAYPGQYLGNFAAMQQNKLTINLTDLTYQQLNLPSQDTFVAILNNSKMRLGPDGKIYFL